MDNQCKVCKRYLCYHGRTIVSPEGIECIDCGLTMTHKQLKGHGLPIYSLPFYDDQVNWASTVHQAVCATCYTYTMLLRAFPEISRYKEQI